MIKIAFDCSKLNTPDKSGTHRFLISFLNELSKRKDIELFYYFNFVNRDLIDYPFLNKGKAIELNTSYYTQLGLLKELPKYDYFVFPWQTVPVLSFLYSGNVVSIIHDTGYSFRTKFFTFFTQIFSKKIFSVSVSTAKSLFRESIPITEGVDSEIFFKIKDSELLELQSRNNLPSKFILSVGRIEDRKNIFNNLKAFSMISKLYPSLKYCFIGKFEISEEVIYSYIDSLGIDRDQVLFKNYVDDFTLNLYLNSCEFLVFTSKDEGFGLPVLEAYNVGKWVILSRIQQLAEFELSAKQLVNYDNPKEIADAMVYFLLNRSVLKREFNTKKILEIHSWKRSVDLFLESLK